MYCKYCGKDTSNESGVCTDCEAAHVGEEIISGGGSQPKTTRMFGFPSAITSFICAAASSSVSGAIAALGATLITLISVRWGLEFADISVNLNTGAYLGIIIPVFVIGIILSAGLAVVAFVFGAKAIGCFKTAASTNSPKPIPSLAVGIAGILAGVETLGAIMGDIALLVVNIILATV